MEQKPAFEPFAETVSSLLERIEVKVGKIGTNSPETALSILTGLDEVSDRLTDVESETSRKLIQGPYESAMGRLRTEARLFLRDLGGSAVLRKARESTHPPADHWWWYIDDMLAAKRKTAMRRSFIYAGAFIVALLILGLVYKFFLAPDPQVIARYGYQQDAQDALMRKDFPAALADVEKGLAAAPDDPTLLILRGIIEEAQANQPSAEKDYSLAQKGFQNLEDFYLTRGQTYLLINDTKKALADAGAALQVNPHSAHAYLLSGQAYENEAQYNQAMANYNKAFDVASANKQVELEAISRTKIAFLMQRMTGNYPTMEVPATQTPVK